MDENRPAYWQPRVMKHRDEYGNEEFAIHEVYFMDDGSVKFYSECAFSPRVKSVALLKEELLSLLEQEDEEFPLGDLGFEHHKEDIKFWLEFIDEPVIDYCAQ